MKKIINSLLALSAIYLFACTTKTETYNSSFNKRYNNGKEIVVNRTDNISHTVGIYSGHEYGQSHSFIYNFVLNPEENKWQGETRQVPQKLLFSNEDVYLLVLGEKTKIDTANVGAIPTVIPTKLYYKNHDSRFFFNWFGEQYFEPIDSIQYYEKLKTSKEEDVPVL